MLEVTEERKEELQAEINECLQKKRLTPGHAAKLKGKLLYAASQLWGKIGRAFLRALSERQYTKRYREIVDKALELSLKEWNRLLDTAPRRKLLPEAGTGVEALAFTDGYAPDERKGERGLPQVGGVVFVKGGAVPPMYFSAVLGQDLIDTWLPRKNQIAMVELFAPALALLLAKDRLRGKRVLFFVDSECVEGALVKGYSSREDMSELVGKFWHEAAAMKMNVYIDRVSTDGNPADGPSRPNKRHLYENLGWIENKEEWRHAFETKRRRAWEHKTSLEATL
jgi:hypothetical protein